MHKRTMAIGILIISLGGCLNKESSTLPLPDDDYETATRREKRAMDNGKLFGDDAFVFGDEKGTRGNSPSGSIGVNSCLWRATLDVLSFLPLALADPFGGVILTDWYTSTLRSDERIKVNVRILDSRLRADALRLSVFRQKLIKGQWVDRPTDPTTARELEDAILTKAREIHIRTVG